MTERDGIRTYIRSSCHIFLLQIDLIIGIFYARMSYVPEPPVNDIFPVLPDPVYNGKEYNMKPLHNLKRLLGLCLCIIMVSACFASAHAEPITAIDLGVDKLSLEAGETYTFNVKYEPEVPQFYSLNWFITDNSVIEIDGPTFTVKALNAGEADILAESFDGISFDVCHVTVTGNLPTDTTGVNSEEDIPGSYVTLSAEDREKVSSRSINRFLDFLDSADLSEPLLAKAQQRTFIVIANVKPGTEEAESKRANDLGMTEAVAIKRLNVVTLQGTLEQILRFAENNEDLVEIFEMDPFYIDASESGEMTAESCTDNCVKETTMLKGHVEELTSVSIAHKTGFDGACSNIAIIDTGINKDHEQFAGRVIAEACFGRPGNTIDSGGGLLINVCGSKDSAMPVNAIRPSAFNHGSHVAGIAAGKNGIAPKAGIIAVQVFTERLWMCTPDEYKDYGVPGQKQLCSTTGLFGPDELMAYDYLLDLAENGVEITAVNMSYGSSAENECPCDSDPELKERFCMFHFLEDANVIPVAASGNFGYDCGISDPACFSNVLAVGALDDNSKPVLALYSNHNEMIDITAPGTGIFSAAIEAVDRDTKQILCPAGDNCYVTMSGTSMAAPMVTGAFALLRQAYPDMSAAGLKSILTGMSTKYVYERENGVSIVPKPVLDFTNFRYLQPMRCFTCPQGMNHLPRTGFSARSVTALAPQPLNIRYSETGLKVMIPSLSIDSAVLSVPFVKDEYPVEWLKDSVGMLEGSGQPGDGVIVLTGHNHIDNTEAGPFVAIGSLNKGDKIMLQDEKGKLFTYTVFANELIKNDDIAAFETQANRSPNSVTLLTCEVEQMEGGYAYRRVISAAFDAKTN